MNEIAEEDKMFLREHDQRWFPVKWKRVFFGVYSLAVCFACVFVLEFSFSKDFSENVVLGTIFAKCLTIIVGNVLSSQFEDELLTAPLQVFMKVGLFMVNVL